LVWIYYQSTQYPRKPTKRHWHCENWLINDRHRHSDKYWGQQMGMIPQNKESGVWKFGPNHFPTVWSLLKQKVLREYIAVKTITADCHQFWLSVFLACSCGFSKGGRSEYGLYLQPCFQSPVDQFRPIVHHAVKTYQSPQTLRHISAMDKFWKVSKLFLEARDQPAFGSYRVDELFIFKNIFCNKYGFKQFLQHWIWHWISYVAHFIQVSALFIKKDMYINTFKPVVDSHLGFRHFEDLVANIELGIQQIRVEHTSISFKSLYVIN